MVFGGHDHLRWTVRRREWLWVLDALPIAGNLRSWWSGIVQAFHGTHGCWLCVHVLPSNYPKSVCVYTKGKRWDVESFGGFHLHKFQMNTHFPYSSLLNFGRGEAALPFCTNGFSNCAFWWSFTALLNMATFDESGESCKQNKKQKHKNALIDWLIKCWRGESERGSRLFTATADDAADCAARLTHVSSSHRTRAKIVI